MNARTIKRKAAHDLAVAEPPWAAEEIAAAVGVHERTVRRWLSGLESEADAACAAAEAEAARVRRDCSALDEALLSET